MKIAHTRAMISAALGGQLDDVSYRTHPHFNVDVPATCPGVPESVLDPRSTWPDPQAYDEQAKKLAAMFARELQAVREGRPAGGQGGTGRGERPDREQ